MELEHIQTGNLVTRIPDATEKGDASRQHLMYYPDVLEAEVEARVQQAAQAASIVPRLLV